MNSSKLIRISSKMIKTAKPCSTSTARAIYWTLWVLNLSICDRQLTHWKCMNIRSQPVKPELLMFFVLFCFVLFFPINQWLNKTTTCTLRLLNRVRKNSKKPWQGKREETSEGTTEKEVTPRACYWRAESRNQTMIQIRIPGHSVLC